MCPYCGEKIGRCQRFCPACNRQLVPPVNLQEGYCKVCGRSLAVDATICPKCKWNVAAFYKRQNEARILSEKNRIAMQREALLKNYTCRKCGNTVKGVHRFCAKCGTPVQIPATTPPPAAYQYDDPYYAPSNTRPSGSAWNGWNIFWRIIAIILGFTLLFGTRCVSCSSEPEDNDGITLEEYNEIMPGMSYEEVCDIVGCDGQASAESDYSGEYFEMDMNAYAWRSEDGNNGYCVITFIDGKVTAKTQVNLE